MNDKKYRIESFSGVPSHLELFLENRYGSMYVTLSYFKELKQIENLYTLLLYYQDGLCEAFIYEIISKECILWNRVTNIESERLDIFSKWVFKNVRKIRKISFRDLTIPYKTQYSICYTGSSDIFINLPDTIEEYDMKLGKKSKTQFKYYIKKIQREISGVTININIGSDCFDTALFEEMASLKERRFDSKRQLNSFNGLKVKQHACFAKKYGRITVISVSDKIIASLLCYKVCDKYFATLVAFDIDYAKYSLGRIVFYLAIQGAIEESSSEFHFLWGGSDYVTHYGGENHQLYTTHVFRSYNIFYVLCLCTSKWHFLKKQLKQYSFFRKLAPYYHWLLYFYQKNIR